MLHAFTLLFFYHFPWKTFWYHISRVIVLYPYPGSANPHTYVGWKWVESTATWTSVSRDALERCTVEEWSKEDLHLPIGARAIAFKHYPGCWHRRNSHQPGSSADTRNADTSLVFGSTRNRSADTAFNMPTYTKGGSCVYINSMLISV